MWRIALAGCLSILCARPAWAQSLVLVSPSTQGQHTLACSTDFLRSFEELHYLATAHFLAEKLCSAPRIEAAVGLWHGQAENSGMIDGCNRDRARQLGALLGKYYHQKAALLFHRELGANATLIRFHSRQSLPAISKVMMRTRVSGGTVIPHAQDRLIVMVAVNPEQVASARRLYARVHGYDRQEEAGTAELLGDNDRMKARKIYAEVLAQAPKDVQQLDRSMYSEQFGDLGMESAAQ